MKEKSFRFRESYGLSVKAMNDKQAGKFIKLLCGYVFDGKYPESNDSTIRSTFTLVKTALDEERKARENGRRGGLLSAQKRKEKEQRIMVIASAEREDCPVGEILKSVLSSLGEEDEEGDGEADESVAKTLKKEAG